MRNRDFNRIVIVLLVYSLLAVSCKKDEPDDKKPVYDSSVPYTLPNISYGNDAQQVMDIYLPAIRSSDNTKVFVLIHGGGWSEGDKSDYADFFNSLKTVYPDYAVVNLNYRLATPSSPGYPKQIDDIQAALNHIQLPEYDLSKQYFLFGASAGAHLALLYGYAFDEYHYVKGISNTVGPVDFTDPAYLNNAVFLPLIANLTGSVIYDEDPDFYEEVSPAKQVTPSSPKTISFYGDADPLIPSSQMNILHDALTANGVYNEATMYHGGHGGWSQTDTEDYVIKTLNFINEHF